MRQHPSRKEARRFQERLQQEADGRPDRNGIYFIIGENSGASRDDNGAPGPNKTQTWKTGDDRYTSRRRATKDALV